MEQQKYKRMGPHTECTDILHSAYRTCSVEWTCLEELIMHEHGLGLSYDT